jgi:hypothetical protein
MPNNTNHAVLVRFLVDRYEDTGDGYMTATQALASSRAYLETMIATPATDTRKDGTVDRSLAALADRFDVIAQSVEDNGEECDGEDIGRWTCSFEIVARFVVAAATVKQAEAMVMHEIEERIGDVIGDSVEEWACNWSTDILRTVTK